jgi:hypothetical protein
VRRVHEPFSDGLRDAGLADARLARKQDHLSLTLAGELPSVEQQRDLMLAADERGEADGQSRLETALQ